MSKFSAHTVLGKFAPSTAAIGVVSLSFESVFRVRNFYSAALVPKPKSWTCRCDLNLKFGVNIALDLTYKSMSFVSDSALVSSAFEEEGVNAPGGEG